MCIRDRDRVGGTFAIGGDSQATVGGQDEGYGYIDFAGWYDVISNREDLSLRTFVGGSSKELHTSYKSFPGDPNNGKPVYQSAELRPLFGLHVSYKWVTFTANNLGEVGVGFKFTR